MEYASKNQYSTLSPNHCPTVDQIRPVDKSKQKVWGTVKQTSNSAGTPQIEIEISQVTVAETWDEENEDEHVKNDYRL